MALGPAVVLCSSVRVCMRIIDITKSNHEVVVAQVAYELLLFNHGLVPTATAIGMPALQHLLRHHARACFCSRRRFASCADTTSSCCNVRSAMATERHAATAGTEKVLVSRPAAFTVYPPRGEHALSDSFPKALPPPISFDAAAKLLLWLSLSWLVLLLFLLLLLLSSKLSSSSNAQTLKACTAFLKVFTVVRCVNDDDEEEEEDDDDEE